MDHLEQAAYSDRDDTMANYDNNIVNGPDLLSQSQPDMLSNFKALDDLINVNHIGFNDPDAGKHKFVTLPERHFSQPVGDAKIIALDGEKTNQTELYFETFTGAVVLENSLTAHTQPLNQPTWSDLGSNVIMKTMRVNAFRGSQEIDFPTGPGIPRFQRTLSVQLTIDSTGPTSGINGSAYIENFGRSSVSILIFSNVANNNDIFGVIITAIGTVTI